MAIEDYSCAFGGPEWHRPIGSFDALCAWFHEQGWVATIEYSPEGQETHRCYKHKNYIEGIVTAEEVPTVHLFRDDYIVTADGIFMNSGKWHDLKKWDVYYWRHHDRILPKDPPRSISFKGDRYLIKLTAEPSVTFSEGEVSSITPKQLYELCYPPEYQLRMSMDYYDILCERLRDEDRCVGTEGLDWTRDAFEQTLKEIVDLLPWVSEAQAKIKQSFGGNGEPASFVDRDTVLFEVGDTMLEVSHTPGAGFKVVAKDFLSIGTRRKDAQRLLDCAR